MQGPVWRGENQGREGGKEGSKEVGTEGGRMGKEGNIRSLGLNIY